LKKSRWEIKGENDSVEIISNNADFKLKQPTAAAIGKFDGMHIGHKKIFSKIMEKKKQGLASCVFTFDPTPSVLFGRSDGKELTTKEEKRTLFWRMGIDILIEFPLSHSTAAMLPEDFVRQILDEQMQVRFLAAGTDLSFGAGGRGNIALLEKMQAETGFTVEIIDKVLHRGKVVSSSYVREQVEAGHMEEAASLLGEPYTIRGNVVCGKHLGKPRDITTLNLLPARQKLLPPWGVYYSGVTYNGRLYRAISNIGYEPAVNSEKIPVMETYIYDLEQDICDADVEILLYAFKRPELVCNNMDALKQQLEKDIRDGREYRMDHLEAASFR